MPSLVPSLQITKSLPYRGGTREVSNRFHFNGGLPGTPTAWQTFADAVVAAEKATLPNETGFQIVRARGYEAGSEVAVYEKVYATAGTYATGGQQLTPLECCALVRWTTPARSSKNHPIYCFNYFHGVLTAGVGAEDTLKSGQKTAFETYATAWITGFSDGTHTLVRATPQGIGATSRTVGVYVSHRDFPR